MCHWDSNRSCSAFQSVILTNFGPSWNKLSTCHIWHFVHASCPFKESRAHRILCQFGSLKNLTFCDISKHTVVLQSKISLGTLTVWNTDGQGDKKETKCSWKGNLLHSSHLKERKCIERKIYWSWRKRSSRWEMDGTSWLRIMSSGELWLNIEVLPPESWLGCSWATYLPALAHGECHREGLVPVLMIV